MNTFVTLDNLSAGIRDWKARPHWSQDFHSSLYAKLDHYKQIDATLVKWWEAAVTALGQWKALRSSVGGINRAAIHERGLVMLPELRVLFDAIRATHGGQEPNLAQAQWTDLTELFALARELKGARSWMFASKLCHFLLPNCVVVTDGQITPTNGASYRDYWLNCQSEWKACHEPERLIAELRAAMVREPSAIYPWSTKITELCYAGSLSKTTQ